MWVRFGYDPRKDFASRYFQNLDYRIRTSGLKEQIVLKRSQKRREAAEPSSSASTNEADAYPYFDATRLPQSRQAFYRVGFFCCLSNQLICREKKRKELNLERSFAISDIRTAESYSELFKKNSKRFLYATTDQRIFTPNKELKKIRICVHFLVA